MRVKSVVIVEDEKWILKGIEQLFKWERFGFSVIHSTTSPNDAFEFIKQHGTDILFVDVKMREMTGFELILKLKNENINPLCVVISGYDDFEYTHTAIKLKVFDYCLKPLSEEDADEILKNMCAFFNNGNGNETAEDIGTNRIDEIITFINTNFDKKITLKEISEKFYFNMNYLSYALKKEFGMPLTEYLKKIRMEAARRLIREGDKTTAEIAEMVGMADYVHFNKTYKKYWGVTPKKDRKL